MAQSLSNIKEVPQPISVVLDGSNYNAWSNAVRMWLRGHRLWGFVTGSKHKPEKGEMEDQKKFDNRLALWESAHFRIISWFSNTCLVSIGNTFGRLDNAKDVWNLLAQRYNSANLAQQ